MKRSTCVCHYLWQEWLFRLYAFIFLCRTNPWVKYPRNLIFFNFESMLYCYEIKAYFFKNLFLSYFFCFKTHLWAKSYYKLGSPRTVFCGFPRKYWFSEKIVQHENMHQICDKKGYVKSWRNITSSLKKILVSNKQFFGPCVLTFAPTSIKYFYCTHK